MEEELQEAVQLCQEQLQTVKEALEGDPENAELLEVYAQLQETLQSTQAALDELIAPGITPAEQLQDQHVDRAADDALHTLAELAGPGPSSIQAQAQSMGPNAAPQAARTNLNNARMHPNNKYYLTEPDFAALASKYPQLKQYMTIGEGGRAQYEYTSWPGTRELTAVLLQQDFGISWSLPEGQLVPPVTNRANYIHWIHDLLLLSCPPGEVVRGLDIGCGANFIYCLLGAALYGWHMTGADITEVALTWSRQHIEANPHMADLLEVRDCSKPNQKGPNQRNIRGQQHPDDDPEASAILQPAFRGDRETFAFTMCNPPFFESIREANQNPNTAFGGTAAEMVHPGGELAFIRQMIQDSLALQDRVHWFTTMLGKKASLKELRKELHGLHVTALRTTEFAQGKTSRWALAWSFQVDPNKAAQPLQRPVTAAPAVPKKAQRQATFSVQGSQLDGRKLLILLQKVLASHGTPATVDAGQWSVVCNIPPGAAAAAEMDAQAKRQKTGSAAASRSLEARLRVCQQQRGKFEVMASVSNNAPEGAAMQFTLLLHKVQQDTQALWQ